MEKIKQFEKTKEVMEESLVKLKKQIAFLKAKIEEIKIIEKTNYYISILSLKKIKKFNLKVKNYLSLGSFKLCQVSFVTYETTASYVSELGSEQNNISFISKTLDDSLNLIQRMKEEGLDKEKVNNMLKTIYAIRDSINSMDEEISKLIDCDNAKQKIKEKNAF